MSDKAESFPAIYAPETPETQAAALLRTEAADLRSALSSGDYKQAGAVLQQAGSCNWDKLVPGNTVEIGYDKRFAVNLSMDKNTSTIELREEMPIGGFFPQYNYVPRLSITDDSCAQPRK